nr:MAG TPA: hypothetical protein [Caudoviricetes sp.]
MNKDKIRKVNSVFVYRFRLRFVLSFFFFLFKINKKPNFFLAFSNR